MCACRSQSDAWVAPHGGRVAETGLRGARPRGPVPCLLTPVFCCCDVPRLRRVCVTFEVRDGRVRARERCLGMLSVWAIQLCSAPHNKAVCRVELQLPVSCRASRQLLFHDVALWALDQMWG